MRNMDLGPPASEDDIRAFVTAHCPDGLPEPLSQLLMEFNGGELFVPGTTIHGLNKRGKALSLWEVNQEYLHEMVADPDRYLVFATTNFGDMLLFDKETGQIIRYDHETGEQVSSWGSLEKWLKNTIKQEKNTK